MFEMESYEFSEGETAAEVCVVLNGSIQGEVSVQIVIDDTAGQGISPYGRISSNSYISLYADFTLGGDEVVLQSTTTRQCVAININDDDILESDETFTLRLETQLDSVVISSPNLQVTIEDNDCKYFPVFLNCIITLYCSYYSAV